MLKNPISKFALLIFAIGILIAIIVLVDNYYSAINLLKDGVVTDAYIIEGSEKYQGGALDQEYYSIKYFFYDENGVKHFGETTNTYILEDIIKMTDNESLKIKFDPNTFESIESSYKYTIDTLKLTACIVLSVFDVILWVIILYDFCLYKVHNKININGKEYTAEVLEMFSNLKVNGIDKYKIRLMWQDVKGKTIVSNTNSIYLYNEALEITTARYVKIKAIGKYAIITSYSKDLQSLNDKMNLSNNTNLTETDVRCVYCGYKYNSADKVCPNCGANSIENNKK